VRKRLPRSSAVEVGDMPTIRERTPGTTDTEGTNEQKGLGEYVEAAVRQERSFII
jgi:hypothetical protein